MFCLTFKKLMKDILIKRLSKPNLIIDWQNYLKIKLTVLGLSAFGLQPTDLSECSDFSQFLNFSERKFSIDLSLPIDKWLINILNIILWPINISKQSSFSKKHKFITSYKVHFQEINYVIQ